MARANIDKGVQGQTVKPFNGTRGIFIPYSLLDSLHGDYYAAAIVSQLFYWMQVGNENMWKLQTKKEISKQLRMEYKTFSRHLKKLIESGIVIVERRGIHNVVRLNQDKFALLNIDEVAQIVDKMSTNSGQNVYYIEDKMSTEKTRPQETTTETTSFPDTFFTQDYVATIMTTNETVDVPSDTEVEEEMTTDDHPLDHSVDHQNYPGGVLDIGLDNNVTTNETIVVPTDTEDNDEVTTPDHQDDHQLDHLDNYSGSPKNDVTTNETTSETQGVSTDIWVSGIMTTSDHWFDHFDHQEDLKEKEKERTKEKEKEKNILNNNIILNYLSSEIVDLNLNNIFNNINNLKEKEKKEIYKERKEKEIQTPGDTDSISYSVSLDPYLNNNLDLNNNNNLELNYKQQSSVNNQDFIVSGVGYNLYAPTPTPTPEKEKKEKERKGDLYGRPSN